MTAAEIVAAARAKGYSLRFEGVGLRVIPAPDAELRALLVENKPAIVALLEAEREAAVAVSDAIRERRYPLPEPKVCAFLIGHAGETCRRCGASWLEHFTLGENAKRPGDRAS